MGGRDARNPHYVFDSEWIAHGYPLPAGYKARLGAGMMTPPPGLGLGGTARTSLTLDNAETYFFRTRIIVDAWGALSTDGANGDVYVEANDSDVRVLGNGYAAYADYGAHVVINRSRLASGNFAAIVAGAGRLDLNAVTSIAGGSVLMVHSVMRPENEVAVATIVDGSLTAAKAAIIVRSANADITLERTRISSSSGVLFQAVVNTEAFATKVTGPVPGTRLRMSDMEVSGDNPVRKQVRNGMLSPVEFERQQILKAEGV